MTKIMSCTCKHEDQDRMYGRGMRVHNKAPKVDKERGWRCTVCLTPKLLK